MRGTNCLNKVIIATPPAATATIEAPFLINDRLVSLIIDSIRFKVFAEGPPASHRLVNRWAGIPSGHFSVTWTGKCLLHCLLLTHYSLLITHFSLLTSHYSLLITHFSSSPLPSVSKSLRPSVSKSLRPSVSKSLRPIVSQSLSLFVFIRQTNFLPHNPTLSGQTKLTFLSHLNHNSSFFYFMPHALYPMPSLPSYQLTNLSTFNSQLTTHTSHNSLTIIIHHSSLITHFSQLTHYHPSSVILHPYTLSPSHSLTVSSLPSFTLLNLLRFFFY